jgi:hypothetical protein
MQVGITDPFAVPGPYGVFHHVQILADMVGIDEGCLLRMRTSPLYVAYLNIMLRIWNNGCNDSCRSISRTWNSWCNQHLLEEQYAFVGGDRVQDKLIEDLIS